MRRIRFESLENREVFSASPLATLADASPALVSADFNNDGTLDLSSGYSHDLRPYIEQDNLYKPTNRLSLEARDQLFAKLGQSDAENPSIISSYSVRDQRNGIIAILIGL